MVLSLLSLIQEHDVPLIMGGLSRILPLHFSKYHFIYKLVKMLNLQGIVKNRVFEVKP